MKLSKNWKRIFAGIMAAIMVFLSVDAGCMTALAAEIQGLNNDTQKLTGYRGIEYTFVDSDEIAGEVYSYEELAKLQFYSDGVENEWDKYSNNFYYNQLTNEWQKVWDALDLVCMEFLTTEIDAISQPTDNGTFSCLNPISLPVGTDQEELLEQITLFLNENPQYYFLNNGYLVSQTMTEDGYKIDGMILCTYEMFANGNERKNSTEAFQAAMDAVLMSIERSELDSDIEILQYLHDYVVENVEYNDEIIADNDVTNEEDEIALSQSAYSALCMGVTVCAGYAETLQLLCNAMGIDTICVTSDDHQWNKVYIDSAWYNVDPTWADMGEGNPISYDYYAKSDATYVDTSDSQYESHIECDFYEDYYAACPYDTSLVNDEDVLVQFPEITQQVTTPSVEITKTGANSETGENQYMVSIEVNSEFEDALNVPAYCYYTLDGSEPSIVGENTYRYRNSFIIEGDYTIKVKVVQSGYIDSETAVYTNIETLPKLENVANKSHFYQKQTFVWKAMSDVVDGYIIKVFNSADSTQIGEEIDIVSANTNFYLYDTSTLAQDASIYYEIYGYKLDEDEQKVPATETIVSGKANVNLLLEPLDVVVKWHVVTNDGENMLVVNVEEDTQDKLCLWFFTDKNGINSLNHFILDMTDGVTEFKYSFANHGVAYDEAIYVLITDEAGNTAFQDGGFVVGGEYKEPVLEPIEDIQIGATGEAVVLEAVIKKDSLMKNFNYKYQWYVAEDDTSKGAAIPGATSNKYEVQIGSFDEKFYYCEVTAEYLTKHTYQTKNAITEEGIAGKHTCVRGELFDTDVKADKIEDQVYDGTAKTPVLTLRNELGEVLVLDTDYTVQYKNNTNASNENSGDAVIEVDFIGVYDALEDAVVNFKILPKKANKDTLEFTDVQTGKEYIYNGNPFTPSMEVKDPERNVLLVPQGDYDIVYNANTDAGTATITLKFKGNYEGRVVLDFEIKPKSAENTTIDAIANQTFTGQPIIPALTIKDGEKLLVVDKDYKVTCIKNTHVGTADVTIEFIGNYEGEKTTQFAIIPRDAADVLITTIAKQEYTGLEITPSLEVIYRNENGYAMVLTKGTNYSVAYFNNIALGVATVTLTFDGDFKGTRVETFEIIRRNAENLTYGELESFVYDGTAHEPDALVKNGEITLVEGIDYIVEYTENTNAGIGKAILSFEGFEGCSGNYTGTKVLNFQINPKSAVDCSVELEVLEDYTFTGSELKPGVTVKDGDVVLVERTEDMAETEGDYIVSYVNNINAGEATVKITFINNYTGESSQIFTIERRAISEEGIRIEPIADQIYNGSMIVPEDIVVKELVSDPENMVTLRPGIDYTVSAGAENTFVGNGVVIIHIELEGESNYIYSGEDLEATFKIIPRGTSKVEISKIPNQKYTGEAITPALELKDGDITLIYGVDYEVSYENNIEVGTEATVIIHFMGNFSGEDMTTTFTIVDPIPEYITSSVFHINEYNGYISKITVGTTVYSLWEALNEREYVSVFDKDGNRLSSDIMLATGMSAAILDEGAVTKRYTIIVTGDVNGDGMIDIADMVAVKAQVLGKGSLSDAKLSAGDVNKVPDGTIDIADFIRIKAHILKKDTILGVSVN